MIRTRRMQLVAATPDLLDADEQGVEALAAALAVPVPEHWPPDLYDEHAMAYARRQLLRSEAEAGWWFYYFIAGERCKHDGLLGAGGYKGSPNRQGSVEIGYSILPACQGQGYASEAVTGLVNHAFLHASIRQVTAETYPHLVASIGVLRKNGFVLDGPGSEPGVVRYVLARRDRL